MIGAAPLTVEDAPSSEGAAPKPALTSALSERRAMSKGFDFPGAPSMGPYLGDQGAHYLLGS